MASALVTSAEVFFYVRLLDADGLSPRPIAVVVVIDIDIVLFLFSFASTVWKARDGHICHR